MCHSTNTEIQQKIYEKCQKNYILFQNFLVTDNFMKILCRNIEWQFTIHDYNEISILVSLTKRENNSLYPMENFQVHF